MNSEKYQKLVNYLVQFPKRTGLPFHRLANAIGGTSIEAIEVVVEAVRMGALEQSVIVVTPTEFLAQYTSILEVPSTLPGEGGEVTIEPKHLSICYRVLL